MIRTLLGKDTLTLWDKLENILSTHYTLNSWVQEFSLMSSCSFFYDAASVIGRDHLFVVSYQYHMASDCQITNFLS